MIPLLKGIHPVPWHPEALRPEAEGDGSPAEAGDQKSPRAHALHRLWGTPQDRIPLGKLVATDWAGKNPEEIWVGKDLGGLQTNPLHTPRSTSASERGARGPTTALCEGQQYLLPGLRLCSVEAPLTHTRAHVSKHNRSVLFTQRD